MRDPGQPAPRSTSGSGQLVPHFSKRRFARTAAPMFRQGPCFESRTRSRSVWPVQISTTWCCCLAVMWRSPAAAANTPTFRRWCCASADHAAGTNAKGFWSSKLRLSARKRSASGTRRREVPSARVQRPTASESTRPIRRGVCRRHSRPVPWLLVRRGRSHRSPRLPEAQQSGWPLGRREGLRSCRTGAGRAGLLLPGSVG